MIVLNDHLLASIPKPESVLRLDLAGYLYEKGYFSFRQAQQFAEVDFFTFEAYLHEQNIYLPYDIGDFDTDMTTLQTLQKGS